MATLKARVRAVRALLMAAPGIMAEMATNVATRNSKSLLSFLKDR